MKFAFVISAMNPGGIENYLLRFLKYYEGMFIPIVILKNGEKGDLYEEYIKIKQIEVINKRISYFNPLDILKLSISLKSIKPDAICDFTGNMSWNIMILGYYLKISNRIVFYRNSRNPFAPSILKNSYNYIANKIVCFFATSILANSKSGIDFYIGQRSKNDPRVKVIHNGIDSQKFIKIVDKNNIKNKLNIPLNSFVIGHVGRYIPEKNHDLMLKIAIKLFYKYDDIFMVFVGQDTKSFIIEKKEEIQTDYSRILTIDNSRNVNEILNSFDVFLFPSLSEGQPNALIEAMITGLPIIASNIPAIKESVPKTFITELLSPDNVDGFVDKIENIYLNRDIKNKFIVQKWAMEYFNHKKQFGLFFNELKKTN